MHLTSLDMSRAFDQIRAAMQPFLDAVNSIAGKLFMHPDRLPLAVAAFKITRRYTERKRQKAWRRFLRAHAAAAAC